MRLLLALSLAFLAVAAPALASAARLSAVPTGTGAGASALEFRWSDLPSGAYEVELEISVGGGRWVRISSELEAREGRFRWRVPPGLCGPVRVRLRAGGEHQESVVAACAFEVAGSASPGPALRDGLGAWWQAAGDGALPGATLCSRDGDSLAPGADAPAIAASFVGAGEGAPRASRPVSFAAHARGPAGAAPRRFRAPRRAPLRI